MRRSTRDEEGGGGQKGSEVNEREKRLSHRPGLEEPRQRRRDGRIDRTEEEEENKESQAVSMKSFINRVSLNLGPDQVSYITSHSDSTFAFADNG